MPKLDSSLALGRATYERWLGTEPDQIAAAAEALRRFEPEHPSLVHLEVRFRRALRIKAMLAEILVQSWRRRMTRSGGGYSRAWPPHQPHRSHPAGEFRAGLVRPLGQAARFFPAFLPFLVCPSPRAFANSDRALE